MSYRTGALALLVVAGLVAGGWPGSPFDLSPRTVRAQDAPDPSEDVDVRDGMYGWEFLSAHYHVRTTLEGPRDRAEVRRMAGLTGRLDAFFETATAILEIPEPDHRLAVFVFGTQREFQAYAQRTNYPGLARSGGFYHIPRRTLITYYRDGWHLRRALYHEGTHQIIDLVAPTLEVPVWLNEGLATVFEAMESEPGVFDPSLSNPRRLPLLRDAVEEGRALPVERVVRLDYEGFHADGFGPTERLHYAQAWGICHLLVNSEHPADRGLFSEILERLERRDPVRELFDEETTTALEERLARHLEGLDAENVPLMDPDDR